MNLKPRNLDPPRSSQRVALRGTHHVHVHLWSAMLTAAALGSVRLAETSQTRAGLRGCKTRRGASNLPWKPGREAERRDAQTQTLSCLSRSVFPTAAIHSYSTGSRVNKEISQLFPDQWFAMVLIRITCAQYWFLQSAPRTQ